MRTEVGKMSPVPKLMCIQPKQFLSFLQQAAEVGLPKDSFFFFFFFPEKGDGSCGEGRSMCFFSGGNKPSKN